MKKIMFLALSMMLTGIVFHSCKKPLDDLTSETQQKNGDVQSRSEIVTKHLEGQIVLGERKANPLSPENMKQAYNNLYDMKISKVLPTHKYVRFLPTLEEFKELQDMDGLTLFDYPLDREIITDGLTYHDSNIPENEITWQYAIVSMNFVSPVKNYEVLDELVVTEYNSQWVREAYRIKGLAYDGTPYGELDSTAPNITVTTAGMVVLPPGGLTCSYPCVKAWKNGKAYCDCTRTPSGDDPVSACGCDPSGNEHVPTGSVQVWDTQHNGGQWEGVEGVRIFTWRKNILWGAIWGRSTFTDANGCWKVNKEFKHKSFWTGEYKPITLGLRLKFKNDKVVIRGMATKTDFQGYMATVQDVMSRHAIDLRDFCIKYGPATPTEAGGEARKRYYAATAMNAFFEYNEYAASDGIIPLDGIDILLHPFDAGGAATPMLDKMNGNLLQELATTFGVSTVLTAVIGPTAGTLLGAAFGAVWIFTPDITFPYRKNDNNSDKIKETFYHEFAHASHFELQPASYWKANIEYVVKNSITNNNSPYGTRPTAGSGRTAVIEMWGMHYGKTLADRQYGLEHSNTTSTNPATITLRRYVFDLERFVPNGTGMPGGFSADSWIPYGVLYDCADNNTLNPSNVSEPIVVADGVMGFSQSAFFASLPFAGNISTVKTRLNTILPAGQTTTSVNALFLSYGY